MALPDRDLDVVVQGASGFTGRLVAEYLLRRYGVGGELRWGLGGRSRAKLEALRAELARATGVADRDLPILLSDAEDEASLAAVAEQTRVVCTTVGPYALHGSRLVAACVRAGTHCCDLSGEVHWMRRMIDAHQEAAAASGARIVHACGFDSIPSDLGVFFLQRAMQARHGAPASHVALRVLGGRGGISGGTAASMLAMLEEAERDPALWRMLRDPYLLNPEGLRSGPDGPDRAGPFYDEAFEAWMAPFVMALINTRIVRRTHALLGRPWGEDFRYDEAMQMGGGPLGFAKAAGLATGLAAVMVAGRVGALRRAFGRMLPAPGEGPSREQRERGWWDLVLLGTRPGAPERRLRVRVRGDRDPGYGSTAKMLGESAVCLAKDELPVGGGFWTPAAAMGEPLLARLQANAGLTFTVEPD